MLSPTYTMSQMMADVYRSRWTRGPITSDDVFEVWLPILHTAPDPPSDPPPDDAPGKDCDDHGPYPDDECPKCEGATP